MSNGKIVCTNTECKICHPEGLVGSYDYSPEFSKAFDDLIDNEGGYSNDPEDPGGETKFGISKRSYPHLDIKNLTREDAKKIYWRDFWLEIRAPELHYAVAFEIFDMSVNHGTPRGIMLLQQALNVADDGKFGKITMEKYKSMDLNDVLMRINGYRLKFYTKLSKWPNFGKGWTNRVADNLLRDAENN